MKENNDVLIKSKGFALRIIKLYKYLVSEKKEFVLSKQLLRSGTSIGANVRESQRGYSKDDFYYKLSLSLKEAEESAYWLELLFESEFLNEKYFNSIYEDCNDIIALLVAIQKKERKIKNNYSG